MNNPINIAYQALCHILAAHLPNFEREKIAAPFPASEIDTALLAQAQQFAQGHNSTSAAPPLLTTLLASINLSGSEPRQNQYHYHPDPLTAANLFPTTTPATFNPQQSLETLYQATQQVPRAHQANPALWLDHFDTLLMLYTAQLPSHTQSVSLYDLAKTTAALAVALSAQDNHEQPLLLIQGDFFGIQDFIFSGGNASNKNAAKILRGRSFHVSLLAELAALRILDDCGLPTTSQIMNAAGKFMILAPNTNAVQQAIEQARDKINQWCIANTLGLVGIGIATQAFTLEQLNDSEKFKHLIDAGFNALDTAKHRRFALCGAEPSAIIIKAEYPHGVCAYNDRLPAASNGESTISADQIAIGKHLTHFHRLMIVRDASPIHANPDTKPLSLPVFDYHIIFTKNEAQTGYFGKQAETGNLLRFWDFSLPQQASEPLWHGYARRFINAHIPYNRPDSDIAAKYQTLSAEDQEDNHRDAPKTFARIACEDRKADKDGNYRGKIALAVLKGDVDNLGSIFERGLNPPSLAKTAALSRQMNLFFSLWLPAYCAEHHPNTYTVFAGGDDFFLIGPWHDTQKLAAAMAEQFAAYVGHNPDLHFSAGISIHKADIPVPHLSESAETALEKAKDYPNRPKKPDEKNPPARVPATKNALTLYGETISWAEYREHIQTADQAIADLIARYPEISTGYLYGMLQFTADQQDTTNLNAQMWRSRFAYRTIRFISDKLKARGDEARRIQDEFNGTFGSGISNLQSRYRIPLFNHLYSKREK